MPRLLKKSQKQEIVFVKKSRMSEKKLCMVGHQVNKSQIGMMMTKVLKPHKWEMVLVKQKRCLMVHYVNQSKIVMITRVFMKLQKQEIILVKKSRMSEKKLCMVGHQVNKSE